MGLGGVIGLSDQTTLHLFFLALAIGLFAPLFRGVRGVALGVCAGFAIVLMGYFFVGFTDRRMALYLGGCEAAVLAFVLLALWRRGFFWLAWAVHALLAIACVGVVIWVRFFLKLTF